MTRPLTGPRVLDIVRAVNALVPELPATTVIATRGLNFEWLIEPDECTVWVDDTQPNAFVANALAGLDALAQHHGVTQRGHLRVAPTQRRTAES